MATPVIASCTAAPAATRRRESARADRTASSAAASTAPSLRSALRSSFSGVQLAPLSPGHVAFVGRRAPQVARAVAAPPAPKQFEAIGSDGNPDILYDAIVIGSGMGGLTTATQMAAKGAKVLCLEKYLIPGGSAGWFEREGYRFDVGSSMMFGFGEDGGTNLLTRALKSVDKKIETILDPTQVHYHLPKSEAHPDGLEVQVWQDYERFIDELAERFPHEKEGLRKFYDDCWDVFNSLNALELKSLEEPRYLLGEFVKHPLECLRLAAWLPSNTGDVARRYIQDPDLLRFIDTECFIFSTVDATSTPMINAGMVFCDRHYGGIRYPRGGVGVIPEKMAEGLMEHGGDIEYRANVKEIITEDVVDEETGATVKRATGVQLADGTVYRAKAVVSNATRWDTFERMMDPESKPESEKKFLERYKKSPSFLSVHMGVDKSALPDDLDVHHIILESWEKMEDPRGTLFVSIPTLLDDTIAPEGKHIIHCFTPDWIHNYEGLSAAEYEAEKEKVADELVDRMEALWPGIRAATTMRHVGTPRTHRRYLGREDGTYGPIPGRVPLGMLGMPFNTTSVKGLYCVGDSTFPGQGVNAVAFSGFACAHRVLADQGRVPTWPAIDKAYNKALNHVRDNFA